MRPTAGAELPRILVPHLANRLGLTRAVIRTEIRRGNWVRLAHGIVLTRPERPTRTDWADVALAVAGGSAGLSGWDALRGRGARLGPAPVDRVLVLTREGRSRSVGPLLIRRTDRPFRTWTTSPWDEVMPLATLVQAPRATADAALQCDDLAVVRSLVAGVVQGGRCTLADIAAELEAGPRNGSAQLRAALHQLGDGARSEAEVISARKLSASDIPAFELNVPVVNEYGQLLYVVDALWRGLRAALEVDSRECHFSDRDWQATLDRHNQLTRYGLSITHYAPSRIIKARDPWLDEVRDWLERRAAELGVTRSARHGVICSPGEAAPYVVRTGRRR